ncbi:hypothetical protein SHI21_13715 [Bacteriovorax sp. PP10]|uniref:Uncharacterized protein n=1 Tax=Bacteriovorax antarcticus TaxID=3088717 RepID=A0ABU5VW49_9BACT|nr:hypothetical protein [Bacteriovorax sp. PP10]MEA9357277.1 hypothetical protein [Bacteriovorax sp. PP10]
MANSLFLSNLYLMNQNYSTPRYNKEAAALAWDRTIEIFKMNLK